MLGKFGVKTLVAAIAVCSLVGSALVTGAGAGTGSSSSSASSSNPLPKTGKCDKSLDPIGVSTVALFESPELSNIDVVNAMEASIKAFNKKYSGVGDHCLVWTSCDDKNDPNVAAECVRKVLADPVNIMGLNDVMVAGGQVDAMARMFADAGYPRMPSPAVNDFRSDWSYPFVGGGFGSTFATSVPVLKAGYKKLYLIGVDVPQLGTIPPTLKPMTDAYGAQYVGFSKVPGGTTDYQQFILAAEDAGADAVTLSLGLAQAVQVLKAAQQLGTDLVFGAGLGNFATKDFRDLGDIADQMLLQAELPPADGDTKRWPLVKNVRADLKASGEAALQPTTASNSAVRSWYAVYFFKKIMEEYADPDNLTRASANTAMQTATNVASSGSIPLWTPNVAKTFLGAFDRFSNPWYYNVTWNGKKLVFAEDMFNMIDEFSGNSNYPQPAFE